MLIIYRHCGPLYRKPNTINEWKSIRSNTQVFQGYRTQSKYTKSTVPSCYQQKKLKCQN